MSNLSLPTPQTDAQNGGSSSNVPVDQSALQGMALRAAEQQGLNPDQTAIFMSLIGQESSWNPNAVSAAGAQGLGQLMPGTAQSVGVDDPFNPVQNLRGSATVFKQNLDAFNGDPSLALAAYNAGPAAVRKYGGIPPYPETQDYVSDILSNAKPKPGGPYKPPGGIVTPGGTAGGPGDGPIGPNFGGGAKPGPGDISYPPGTIGNRMPLPLPDVGGLPGLGSLGGNYLPSLPEIQSVMGQRSNFTYSVSNPASNISKAAAGAIATAREYLGTPYVWGGESAKGFDCSGLLQYVWAQQGVNIPRTTYEQFQTGKQVSLSSLQPGDAVFFKGSDSIVQNGKTLPGHVAMYIGHGEVIQAPHTGTTVQITPLKDMGPAMGARSYG